MKRKRNLSVPDRHMLKIARDTLRMNDVGASIMGGPTKAEARAIILRLTGRQAKENPRRRSRRNSVDWVKRWQAYGKFAMSKRGKAISARAMKKYRGEISSKRKSSRRKK